MQAGGIPGIAWPPMAAGSAAANLLALARQLEETQWLAPERHRAGQLAQLGQLAPWLKAHSPAFARRLAAAGLNAADLATEQGLAALPPIERRWLQTEEGVACDRVPVEHQPCGTTATSGSTGEFLVVRRTQVNQLVWMAMVLRDHSWRGTDFSLPMATVRAGTMEIAHYSNWGAPATLLRPTGPALTLPIKLTGAEMLAHLRQFGTGNLVIYPNALGVLLTEVERTGGGIETLRQIRTVGEMVTPELRARTVAALGLKIEDAYSSQEMGYIALQCPDSENLHVMAEGLIGEVLRDDGTPCGEGEIGRVALTDLHNFATPMIRYLIGDLAEMGGPCPCGRGLPALRRVVGRSRNLMLLPDGERIWPTLGGLSPGGYLAKLPVLQYQLVQTALDQLEVRLVVSRPFTADDEAIIREAVTGSLRFPMEVTFSYFEGRIPLPKSGKFEDFLCLV